MLCLLSLEIHVPLRYSMSANCVEHGPDRKPNSELILDHYILIQFYPVIFMSEAESRKIILLHGLAMPIRKQTNPVIDWLMIVLTC